MASPTADLFGSGETGGVLRAFSTEIVRRYDSFEKFFSEARRLKVITFCESPKVLLNLFEERGLEEMTVMVGDRSDYRSDLSEEDLEVASRLEKLRREGKLKIYVKGGWKTVHAKMYLIEKPKGEVTVLVGSANLTETGWSSQENYMAVFETRKGSPLHEQFEEDFWVQVEDYGTPFMADLSEQVEETETEEERRRVIKRWLAGKEPEKPPIEEITASAIEQIREGQGEDETSEKRIRLNLRDHDKKERSEYKKGLRRSGGSVTGDMVHVSPGAFSDWMVQREGVPLMWVDGKGVGFAPPGGEKRILTEEVPSEQEPVGEVLRAFEGYFESVDASFARTRKPEAVKAQMAEALFYFMWAPFANRHAGLFRRSGVEDFGKQLPFLYIWGESNSGKGTLAQYGLRLVSGGQVTKPLDGSELGKQAVRRLRPVKTSFPVVFDDVEKRKIKQASPLRNYWSTWEPDRRFSPIVFTSNDNRPPEWFQNRAKILQFSVFFQETPEAQIRLNRLTGGWARLFAWTGHKVARRFREGEVDPLDGDVLHPVRKAVEELYGYAGRSTPSYLPLDTPAEVEYDLDREQWLQLWRSGAFEPVRQEGNLHLEFDRERFDSKELYAPIKRLPQRLRAQKSGTTIVVPHPEAFWEWLGARRQEGLWDRAKRLVGLGRKQNETAP